MSTRDIGQMNVCVDKMERKGGAGGRAPWLELVKSEPAAKTGCGSYSVPLSSFVFTVWFKKKHKTKKITLGTVSRDTL